MSAAAHGSWLPSCPRRAAQSPRDGGADQGAGHRWPACRNAEDGPGPTPAALPTTGRPIAAGCRQGCQELRQGTPPNVRWRSGGFRAAGNRPQDAPSAEGESRSGSCLRQGRGGRRMRTRKVGLSRRLRRRTGICPEGTSVRRHWPLWPGKVSRRSRDPFTRRAGCPGWRPPIRAVRDEGVPAGAGGERKPPILHGNSGPAHSI